LIKDKNYIFAEVSAKSAANINTVFNKDVHDAIMYRFQVGMLSSQVQVEKEKENTDKPNNNVDSKFNFVQL